MFAHSVRFAPDLGGRHNSKRNARPNMRTNRMHNVVWVDDTEFSNIGSGSTTSGKGWTTSFSPQTDSQYTANSAWATSHPHVKLYQRSTAMIDGENPADMYVFDVFRIDGGKIHTYCFHGAYGEEIINTNVNLKPATSAQAKHVLHGRPEHTCFEGVASDVLEMTWPTRDKQQKAWQGEAYQANRPASLTLHLFGVSGHGVYLGNATSKTYPVDMPYLLVRSESVTDTASVYPAIFESGVVIEFLKKTSLRKKWTKRLISVRVA